MKNIIKLIVVLIGAGLLFSCEKQVKEPVLDVSLTASPTITAPASGTAYELLEENQADIITTFQWDATQYNLDNLEATKYNLQIDFADSSFSSFKTIVSTTENSYEISVGEINGILLTMGLIPGEAGDVELRLYSYINNSSDITDAYSNTISLTFTPYGGFVEYPKLWVPGDYQGWDPAAAPNVYSFNSDNIYTGYLFFPEDAPTFEFKFTSAPDWGDLNYGAGEEEGTLDTDGGASNLAVPASGGYQVIVNTDSLTWHHSPQSWGIIGEWLAWAEDIDMLWDADNQYLYLTVDVPDVADNRFKFRANDDWAINLGTKDPDDGTLIQDGSDIPFPGPGNYTFILNFTTPEPTYELIAN